MLLVLSSSWTICPQRFMVMGAFLEPKVSLCRVRSKTPVYTRSIRSLWNGMMTGFYFFTFVVILITFNINITMFFNQWKSLTKPYLINKTFSHLFLFFSKQIGRKGHVWHGVPLVDCPIAKRIVFRRSTVYLLLF